MTRITTQNLFSNRDSRLKPNTFVNCEREPASLDQHSVFFMKFEREPASLDQHSVFFMIIEREPTSLD